MSSLEDSMDEAAANEVRALLKEANQRVDESVINYRFGMQVTGVDEDQVEELLHFTMTLTYAEILREWNGTDAMLPAMLAAYTLREVKRGKFEA